MKRGAIGHPKVLRLMRALSIRRYEAVGILESLWHWTSRYAIRGDLGKYENQDIADGIDWAGDATVLVDALAASGWLDHAEGARLVIHDIQDHADNTWRQCLQDAGLTWWDDTPPRRRAVGRPPVRHKETPEKLQSNSSLNPQPEPEPEPEPEPKRTRPLRGRAADAAPTSRATWLTPYLDAWCTAYGGQLAPGKAAKALAPVRAAVTDAEALARWARYLAATESRFASAARFSETHGEYANGTQARRGPPRTSGEITHANALKALADAAEEDTHDEARGHQTHRRPG